MYTRCLLKLEQSEYMRGWKSGAIVAPGFIPEDVE
jgi:hypothetical protein